MHGLPADEWRVAKQCFEELFELPAEVRAQRLSEIGAQSPRVRDAVGALLTAHEECADFLTRDASIPVGERLRAALEPVDVDDDLVGGQIDQYRIIERLGEGGFSTVYHAQQQSPIERPVALKILKPGMDSRSIVARFEIERQSLALMDHACIARVFDAGQTQSGRPYFAMELVRGSPITNFCDERQLSISDRLRLFTRVCLAVHHAHQKGVIHRDLKPGNILVATEDGAALPKVIDFGIAKAVHRGFDASATLTGEGHVVGTPAYMSPEQLDGGGANVDTRTDVYALGVVLFELLTGAQPFDVVRAQGEGGSGLRRIVLTDAPPRLSARVRARWASKPGGAPAALLSALRGDLDWIAMKCLEQDRERRYSSAGELAADIQRHLAGEAVLAAPPSAAYRFSKFVKRHRVGFVATMVVAASLVIGMTLATIGLIDATRARSEAETRRIAAESSAADARASAAKAQAVSAFMQRMLSAADPRESARRDLTVREILERTARELDDGALNGHPDVEAAARLVVGRAYRELAQYDRAAPLLDAAVEQYRELRGDDHEDVADALQQRAVLHKDRGRLAEAEADFRAALAIRRRHPGENDEALATVLSDLPSALSESAYANEAEGLLREAVSIIRRPAFDQSPRRAEALNNLAFVMLRKGQRGAAEGLFREAAEINRRLLGDRHPNLATNLDNLAQLVAGGGRLDEAEALYREALEIRRAVFAADHPEVATTLHNLATLLYRQKRLAECDAALRESLDMFRRIHGLANNDTLTVLQSAVSVAGGLRDYERAESLLREAFDACRESASVGADQKRALAARLSELYRALHREAEAAAWAATAESFQATTQLAQ